MGRELKRVPLDFNWPLNKTWDGYLNPHFKKCPDCENGSTNAMTRLTDLVHLLMLSGSDSIGGKNHPYFDHISRGVYGFNSAPSKDMIELTSGLAGRTPSGFGHDACDNWSAVKKIIKSAGLNPKKWGICPTCKGDSLHPDQAKLYHKWKPTEPPTGEGFQLWETTSEGSPTSPVFSTLESLCEWLEPNSTTFGSNKTSKENWMQMLDGGHVHHKEGNMIFI